MEFKTLMFGINKDWLPYEIEEGIVVNNKKEVSF
jgi:hypothetical protein